MRVLVTTTGNPGHLLPLVPVATALSRAGHDVIVATQRSRASGVHSAGLAVHAFDDPPEAAWREVMAATVDLGVDDTNARVVGDLFARIDTRAALPGVLDVVERWRPDVVLRETYEFAGALAAEVHHVPHVRVGLGLAHTEAWAVDLARPALDELRAELGLPRDPAGERVHRSPYVSFVPESLEDPAVPGPPRTMRYCARPAPVAPSAPGPAGHGPPLVYASLGTVTGATGQYFPGLYRDLIEALADLPVRALVTTGRGVDLSALGTLPPDVRVEHWVDPRQVLPRTAVAISHGGFGTTLDAIAHGVPVVVLPLFAGDQWQLARRVADTGAGVALPRYPEPGRRSLDPPSDSVIAELPRAVMRLLDGAGQRRAVRELADEMAALPPVDDCVGDLLSLVGDLGAVPPVV